MKRITITITIFFTIFTIPFHKSTANNSNSENGSGNSKKKQLIDVRDELDDLVWVVQLSDLHFSVHHPSRAQDFRDIVGPTLSFIKPSLVLLTGDLTDGKSKDHLTMKQNEKEWMEYQKVMQDVVKRSRLDKSIFYDVRGNHDNFGVPIIGGPFDFFSKYSISGKLQRTGKVNSATIQTRKRKILFVGFDSTMSTGLRGPTNLFGHPTDELLTEINSELSQWDSQPAQPVTKVSFGHFPLSFSAAAQSGKTLQDIFHMHSLAAYVCGHLHLKFGENLKRYHQTSHHSQYSKLFQLNGHRNPSVDAANCSPGAKEGNGFWELEMGDWRKSRAMRIMAIDRGHTSFVDVNFTLGAKKTIILPTFPLDSRFTLTSARDHKCGNVDRYSHRAIRALVFSRSPIVSVSAKIYDSRPGNLVNVLDTPMKKLAGDRGDFYVAPWYIEAYEDPSPRRYVLQIEATDAMGRTTFSELRPFSVVGSPAKFSWKWKEFFVMGCQWDSLYYPILWCFYFLALSVFLLPKAFLSLSRRQYTYKDFKANKGFINGLAWVFTELFNIPAAWCGMTAYLFYLLLCPWFYGQVFTEGQEWGYMTYRGWVLGLNNLRKPEFIGSPDVMVVVLPHLYLVTLPAIVAIVMLAAERGIYRDYLRSLSSKKNDDRDSQESAVSNDSINKISKTTPPRRRLRKIFLVVSVAVCCKHFMSCVALMKAYEMIPFALFPVYSFGVPLLLTYTIWTTR